MKPLTVFKALGPIDAKSVLRDSLLQWMVILPILPALVVRWGLPSLTAWIADRYNFDLTPLYPLIASFFTLFIPVMYGVLIGFLLLDERDDRTLAAIRVTPLSPVGYLAYRISIPILLSVIMTLIAIPITKIVSVSFFQLLPIVLLAALEAPISALILVSFVKNKVAGLALYKGFSIFFFAPLAVYFIHSPWQILAGIMPTYWPVKVFWSASERASGFWIYWLVGVLIHGALLGLLLKRFQRVVPE